MYSYKLDDIVSEYNNTYHKTIKMKPVDLNSITYFDFGMEDNAKDLKFKVGHHVVFVIKKIENTTRRNMLLVILAIKKIVGCFYEKE